LIEKSTKRHKFSFNKKASNFTLSHIITFLTVQQIFILFPFFRPGFEIQRWNDDFVVLNEWKLNSFSYNLIPKSVDSWIGDVRSRAFMPKILVGAFRILGQNQNMFLLTVIICWFIALVCLAFLFTKIFPTPAALIVTLLVGSSPYRNDFFPYMQGSGYVVVFLLFSITACLVYFSFQARRMVHHNIFLFSALFTLYISFYFYEIAIIGTGFFSILCLYFRQKSKLIISKKRIYFEATTFLIVGTFHALIIMTAANPMWNRSSVSNFTFANLAQYISDFTGNYVKTVGRPFYWIFIKDSFSNNLIYLLQNILFIMLASLFVYIFVFSILRFTKLAHQNSNKVRLSKIYRNSKKGVDTNHKFWDYNNVHIFLSSIFLVLSPYLGFLTFSGGFPVRLSLLAIPGFAIIVGLTFTFFDSHIVSIKNRIRLLCFYLSIPMILSLFAAYQSQSISSVSIYDHRFESKLLSKLPSAEQIDFPIILHIGTPACAESSFWDQTPSGSIWGANNGQLNLANSFGLLSKKDPDLSRILYIPVAVNLPPELSIKIASNYCNAGKAITIPENLLPQVPKHNKMYPNNLQYYVDPNLNIIEINPS
jgi:hypothetical protein